MVWKWSVCGYDESADREKYPTLICPAKSVSSCSEINRQRGESHRQKEWEEQKYRESQLQEHQEEQVRKEQVEHQEKWKKEIEPRQLEDDRRQRPERKVIVQRKVKVEKMPVRIHRSIMPTEKPLVKKRYGKWIWFGFEAIILLMTPLNVIFLIFLILKMIPFRVKERKLGGGIYTGTATSFGFSPKKGQMLYPNGNVYEGKWRSCPNGYGVYTLVDEISYEGRWKGGKLIEKITKGYHTKLYQGIYVLSGGAAYIGTWTETWFNWNRTGQGTMYYADGSVYTGEWKDNVKNGQGSLIWPSGDRYEGGFVDGGLAGQGTMYYADGSRYEGQWGADCWQGQGTIYYADGTQKTGTWIYGEFQG